MPGIFDGLKVLDFCWVVIGPMTTRYFSDYGATVVRVESKHRPDVIRNGLPYAEGKAGINRSGYWANYNSGKMSMALNMADPRARALAFELATTWADVITENFTPGTIEKWGLGYDDISRLNPNVVMFSASMLGRGGPNDSQPGFGPVLTALAGHTHFTGWPDRVPVSPYGAYTDFLIPHMSIAAIIAALDHREVTGKGQHLDLSQLEASLYFLAPAVLDYTTNDRVTSRQGNSDSLMAPHNTYPCIGDDRWCAIACADDTQWKALATLLGQPELASDSQFATLGARKANEEALDALVGTWTAPQDANEVMRRCQEAGIAAGAVQDSRGLFSDPQLSHRGHFVFQDHPEMGRYASDGNCFTMSGTTPEYRRAPLLGEHTLHVLSQILGMSPERIAELQQDGVLE